MVTPLPSTPPSPYGRTAVRCECHSFDKTASAQIEVALESHGKSQSLGCAVFDGSTHAMTATAPNRRPSGSAVSSVP